MLPTKTMIESSTIINGVIGFLVLLVSLLGLDLDEGLITELVMAIVGLYTLVRVIIGRINATEGISGIV